MAKKADAWQEYKEAALVDMMLKVGFPLSLFVVCLFFGLFFLGGWGADCIDSCNGYWVVY